MQRDHQTDPFSNCMPHMGFRRGVFRDSPLAEVEVRGGSVRGSQAVAGLLVRGQNEYAYE